MADCRWTETGIIAAWTAGRGVVDLQELDAAEALAELPLLGLRLHRGVDWKDLRSQAEALNLRPLCDAWEAQLRALAKEDLVIWEGDHVRLGARGMLMSNGILQMFV
jgi:oxygen-independent coproporphyrinogen-3 oxidase